jgi:hypothetical protein
MQYLLTAEEYDNLVKAPDVVKEEQKAILQKACTRMAEEIPIGVPWHGDKLLAWGCILTNTAEYCDCCPARDICPASKNYSK